MKKQLAQLLKDKGRNPVEYSFFTSKSKKYFAACKKTKGIDLSVTYIWDENLELMYSGIIHLEGDWISLN